MVEQVSVYLDTATCDLPKLDDRVPCPDHRDAPVEVGFGLAGGGYGTYTCCSICCRVLTKTLVEDDAS